jgi:hypothetical protein
MNEIPQSGIIEKFSIFLDHFSEFFAHRKGLLPMVGILLVVVNFVLQLFPAGWLSQTNCFLHLGIILAIFGLLLTRAL